MREWNELVRRELRPLRLREARRVEFLQEISGYIEDLYQEQLGRGASETDAVKACVEELTRFREARPEIEGVLNGETMMNARTRTLWLPGFVSLAAASVVMMILEFVFFFRNWVRVSDQVNYAYFVWLALLPRSRGRAAITPR